MRGPAKLAGRAVLLALLATASCGREDRNSAGIFLERTDTGIDFVHHHFGEGKKHLVEINGGSACLLDYDGDGDLDVAFGQGAPLSPEAPAEDWHDGLYRNDGDFHFTRVTEETGACEDGYTLSVAAPDYDGDGDPDLYFCNFRENRLLRNDGGHFVDVTAAVGLGSPRWTSSAAFADFDQDGDLDVYLCNYVIDDLVHPGCGDFQRGEEWRSYCDPNVFAGSHDQLFRNDGGTFVEVTREAGMEDADGNGLAAVACDFDDDGDLDLFVANDQSPNFLWRNEGGLHFVDVAGQAGVAVGESGASQACMGTDWADVDRDGDFDLIAANLVMETNALYVNEGGGLFTDRSRASGLGAPSLIYSGFGCEFFDADLDGDCDLLVANGHVIDNIQLYEPSQTFHQPPQYYANDGHGHFQELGVRAGPFFAGAYVGRGLAVGDLDDDGDQDAILADNNSAPHVLENQMSLGRSWIGFRLHGKGHNTAALGSRVTLVAGGETQRDEVRGTSSYGAFQDLRLVFGLDQIETADEVTVRWADGAVTHHGPLRARRYHNLVEE